MPSSTEPNNPVSGLERIMFARAGGAVRRWHTFPRWHPPTQTVAEHTFNMFCLMDVMCNDNHPGRNDVRQSNLFIAVMCHDLGEQLTGDVAKPFKMYMDQCGCGSFLEDAERAARKAFCFDYILSPEEYQWLDMCDYFEACFTVIEQYLSGNHYVCEVAARMMSHLPKLPKYAEGFSFYVELRNALREVALNDNQSRVLQKFSGWSPWKRFTAVASQRVGTGSTEPET